MFCLNYFEHYPTCCAFAELPTSLRTRFESRVALVAIFVFVLAFEARVLLPLLRPLVLSSGVGDTGTGTFSTAAAALCKYLRSPAWMGLSFALVILFTLMPIPLLHHFSHAVSSGGHGSRRRIFLILSSCLSFSWLLLAILLALPPTFLPAPMIAALFAAHFYVYRRVRVIAKSAFICILVENFMDVCVLPNK